MVLSTKLPWNVRNQRLHPDISVQKWKGGVPKTFTGRPPTFFQPPSVGLQDIAQVYFSRVLPQPLQIVELPGLAPRNRVPLSRGDPTGKLHFLGGSESRLRQDPGLRPGCLCAADAAAVLQTVDEALSWASGYRSGLLQPRPSTAAPNRRTAGPRP